ncbi:MAG: NUDIX hydrolase [Rhizobiaceae bacterium]|nr:NUDIX hydrolase [Rhizobiaceae bacterium]
MASLFEKSQKFDSGSDSFLSELAHTDALFQAPAHDQYAAMCYRKNSELGVFEMLLVTSRESGRWIIPKGWPIKGKKPHEVAATEAFEEAGVRGKIKKKPFGYFTYLKQFDDGTRAPCIVQVHLLEVEKICDIFKEKGERIIEWVSFTEAARRVREPELKGLILVAERKLRRTKGKK